MKILLLSDIHGNYPALEAISHRHPPEQFDHIFNCGDCTVYGPFPEETLNWLRRHKAHSIRGNTDDKVIRLLQGKSFKKPSKPEKRIMYTTTLDALGEANRQYLCALKKRYSWKYRDHRLCLYHGSPARHEEFLFASTETARFAELAKSCSCTIVVTGHSHTPYHKHVEGVHFINPGSVGRMFDGNPQASYASITLRTRSLEVRHYRCSYDVEAVVRQLDHLGLPPLYSTMFRTGRKLN